MLPSRVHIMLAARSVRAACARFVGAARARLLCAALVLLLYPALRICVVFKQVYMQGYQSLLRRKLDKLTESSNGYHVTRHAVVKSHHGVLGFYLCESRVSLLLLSHIT